MIKKLMMMFVATMAAMGAMAVVEKSAVLGDWYEAHDIEEVCMLNRWADFAMGANVAIPVTGLASPISASDVVVTAGTYSEFGTPYVLTEGEMWNRYGAPVLKEKNLGNVEFDWYDNVWQNWDAEEDGAYGYELSADIWPNWSQVSGRQWILIPTGVPRSGTHTFSVKINGVEHNNYVVSFVMAEDQEPVPYGCQVSFNPNGGEVVEDNREVVAGKSVGTLPTPTRSKYKFLGWYTAPEGGTKISATSKVTGDVTYYAQWVYDGSDITLQESYGPFVPGAEVELNLGLVGYAAKKLPSGLKLDKKTGIVKGKAKKPGEYQVTFTKKGAETLTAKFIVGPMPTITITMEGDIEKCRVTGASKAGKGYLVGKKVSLSAKGPKGTAFIGWFKDGEPWPNETEYLESKLKYVMTEENLSLVACFEKEKMSVACDGLSTLIVGEEVSIPVTIETQSGVKSVKGSKLPSGLKIKKDKATGEWFVTGKPKKVGVWNSAIKVTAKSGAVEQLPVAVTVSNNRAKVQLWENGPYWATTNIGAEKPEDYGYYFWWGDTVGYLRKNDKWVASDGSNSIFSFDYYDTLTNVDYLTLLSKGWITSNNILVPQYDAAYVQWGGNWRMPTDQELSDLCNKCDWKWTSMNGVNGYFINGRGSFVSSSIFLPCAGRVHNYDSKDNASLRNESVLYDAGSEGYYWSSVPVNDNESSWNLAFGSDKYGLNYYYYRSTGRSIRPVQGFTK